MTDSVRRSPAGVGPSNELEKVKDAEKALAPASEVEARHRELVGQFESRLPTFPSPADASALKDSAPNLYEPSIELTAALIDDFVTVEQRRAAAGRSWSPDPAMFEGLSLKVEQYDAIRRELRHERIIREMDAAWAVVRKPLEDATNDIINLIDGSKAREMIDHYRAIQKQIDHGDDVWRIRHATNAIGYANRRLIDKNLSRLEPAPRNPPTK